MGRKGRFERVEHSPTTKMGSVAPQGSHPIAELVARQLQGFIGTGDCCANCGTDPQLQFEPARF